VLRTAGARDWRSGKSGIAITVADNGSGMDSATLSHVFEPFFSTKGITGTGLGLWISQEIVSKHHGTLRVRSRAATGDIPGGTLFRLFLPAETEASDSAASEQNESHQAVSVVA
jgi:signal transduction histidine kinase